MGRRVCLCTRVQMGDVWHEPVLEGVRWGGVHVPRQGRHARWANELRLKSGGAGKGKIGVKGGGANLHLPMLPLTTPVRVQLRRTDSNVCWDATYSTAVTNTVSEFKARSD